MFGGANNSGGARAVVIAALALAFSMAFPAAAAADWQSLGTTLNSDQSPMQTNEDATDIVGVGGVPWATWSEWNSTSSNYQVKAATWNGTAWVQMGGVLNADPIRRADAPAIADVGGVPYVTWHEQDGSGTRHVRVAKWNGSAWEAVGSILDNAGGSIPQIVGIAGVPYVVWGGAKSGGNLQVSRWNGVSWIAVGAPLSSGSITKPVIGAVGTEPYVAWSELSSGAQVLHVARFDGTTWQDIGSPAHGGATESLFPSVAGISGSAYVAWLERVSGSYQLRVAQRTGGTWTDLGGSITPAPGNGTSAPSLTGIGGTPYVAWADGQAATNGKMHVAGWSGGAWTLAGSALSRSGTTDGRWADLVEINADAYLIWDETPETLSADYDVFVSTLDLGTPPPMPPDTTITNDSVATNSATALYSFTASPAVGATFECSYDGEPFVSCTSPWESGILSPGNHTFRVRATNAEGTDPTPALRAFVVDRVKPTVALQLTGDRTPSGAYAGGARIDATATDPAISSGIRNKFCVLDPPSPPTTFSAFGSNPCGSDVTTAGTHTVYAIGNDNAGNESDIVSQTFTVVERPTVQITGGPSGGTWFKAPQFSFASPASGATFQCRVDSQPFASCKSPWMAPSFDSGSHGFEVKVTNAAGVESLPARRDYSINTPATTQFGCELRPFLNITDQSNKQEYCGISTGTARAPRGELCLHSESQEKCVPIPADCPAGAQCTVKTSLVWSDGDPRASWFPDGRAAMVVYDRSKPLTESVTSCSTGDNDSGCKSSASLTGFGPQAVLTECNERGMGPRPVPDKNPPILGKDENRSLACSMSLTVVPAEALAAAAANGTVSLNAPGPGNVEVAPGGGKERMLAVAKPGGEKAKLAFKPVTLTATDAGQLSFSPKLSKASKRTLKRKKKLKLSLQITYTPEGGEPTSATRVVTLRVPKKILKEPRPKK
ncbi:MAG: hypothetical protein U0R24_09810 [Solirubrobacterales bacterium]